MDEAEQQKTYCVVEPMMAVKYSQQSKSNFVTIPRGAVITIRRELTQIGVIEVDCDGETLAVFTRDLDGRVEPRS